MMDLIVKIFNGVIPSLIHPKGCMYTEDQEATYTNVSGVLPKVQANGLYELIVLIDNKVVTLKNIAIYRYAGKVKSCPLYTSIAATQTRVQEARHKMKLFEKMYPDQPRRQPHWTDEEFRFFVRDHTVTCSRIKEGNAKALTIILETLEQENIKEAALLGIDNKETDKYIQEHIDGYQSTNL